MRFRLFLTLALASSFAAGSAFAGEDKAGAKLRIMEAGTDPNSDDHDCKISLKEIRNYKAGEVGNRYICAQLIDANTETTLADLFEQLTNKKVVVTFEGQSTQSLMDTFNAWQTWLIADANRSSDAQTYLKKVQPYTFSVVSRTENLVTIKLANTESNQSVDFEVRMGVEAP